MADKIIDLNFIPLDLDGNPLTSEPLSKIVGKLMCETNSYEYVLEKYLLGKELFNTGVATFTNVESVETQTMIAYFKKYCEEYTGFPTQVKGQILLKII